MNALDKLDAVQVSADNRISETDRKFCERTGGVCGRQSFIKRIGVYVDRYR